jgi:hypothetical protein
MSWTAEPEDVQWAWQGRLPLNSIDLFVGNPELNKSAVATEIAARIARGQLDGDLKGEPAACRIASAEDTWTHTTVPRLMAEAAHDEEQTIDAKLDEISRLLAARTSRERWSARLSPSATGAVG